MSRNLRSHRVSALRIALATASTAVVLAASACSSAPANPDGDEPAPLETKEGGTLVIGQEQQISCTDWIGSCAGSIWGTYAMQVQTIPAAFAYRQSGDVWQPAATSLMATEPTSEEVDGDQVITYRINPEAVWSDGEPITSADFKYTAVEIRDGKEVLDRTGYSRITSVKTPDPETAVVTLKGTYPNWRDLFSGFTGVLPAHLLEGKDRGAEMKAGYDWSGGPWKIEEWKQGESVTLVPNNKYWGDQPRLDKVVFQVTSNTAAEFQAFKSGQLDAIFPTPQLDAIQALKPGSPTDRRPCRVRAGRRSDSSPKPAGPTSPCSCCATPTTPPAGSSTRRSWPRSPTCAYATMSWWWPTRCTRTWSTNRTAIPSSPRSTSR